MHEISNFLEPGFKRISKDGSFEKQKISDPKECQCGEVLKGILKPPDCKVFGSKCTPENPL